MHLSVIFSQYFAHFLKQIKVVHFVNKNIFTKHNFTRGSDSESLVCYSNVYEIPVSKKIRFNLTAIILFIMDQPFQHDILG